VTRQAIMRGLPEARLAAKVMDYDGFIEKFLGGRAGEWYESIADTWKWNSRYWEQRALLTMKTDIDRATEYAEQAVAIEKRKHPYALTTLAKIKFEKACRVLPGNGAWDIFEQAMQVAEQAIERGHWLRRPEVHPYDVAVRSSARFVAKARRHGKRVAVDKALAERIASYIDEVRRIGSSGQARALENVWWKARTSGSRGA